eukprot:scaffold1949_cov348-Pavlova_lutheri.AAC.15
MPSLLTLHCGSMHGFTQADGYSSSNSRQEQDGFLTKGLGDPDGQEQYLQQHVDTVVLSAQTMRSPSFLGCASPYFWDLKCLSPSFPPPCTSTSWRPHPLTGDPALTRVPTTSTWVRHSHPFRKWRANGEETPMGK